MYKRIFISLGIFLLLLIGTTIVVIYGKGYSIDFSKGKPEIAGSGLLVATSNPDGAQVFINEHLTTATNNTINLIPGTYNVRIFKDGYFDWSKTLKVQKEVVAKADASLFLKNPTLESLTELGVNNPVIDPTHTHIAFTIASQSAKQNGIYVFNMSASPLLTLQSSTQLTDETQDILFSKATLTWSPDGKNILASVPNASGNLTEYLLDSNSYTSTPQDVTETLSTTITAWQKQTSDIENARIAALPLPLRDLATKAFAIIAWSDDQTKILYTASTSATIPLVINPPLIGANSTPEERNIQSGKVYVYDVKEDKNFPINASSHLSWMPDSKHLIYVHDKKIDITEYDGTNQTTIFAGPFVDSYVFPWPDGSKLVVLTNLGNTDITPNLYTITLR